jgi:hypothetical protein
MKSWREVVAAMRQTPATASCSALPIMPERTGSEWPTDCRVTLTCSCGYQCRTSSELGAFMSGWRKISWEDRTAQCWSCDRTQRADRMAPYEPGRCENV